MFNDSTPLPKTDLIQPSEQRFTAASKATGEMAETNESENDNQLLLLSPYPISPSRDELDELQTLEKHFSYGWTTDLVSCEVPTPSSSSSESHPFLFCFISPNENETSLLQQQRQQQQQQQQQQGESPLLLVEGLPQESEDVLMVIEDDDFSLSSVESISPDVFNEDIIESIVETAIPISFHRNQKTMSDSSVVSIDGI